MREEIESPRVDEHEEDEAEEEDEEEHDAVLDPIGILELLQSLGEYPHRAWTKDAAAIYRVADRDGPIPKAKQSTGGAGGCGGRGPNIWGEKN